MVKKSMNWLLSLALLSVLFLSGAQAAGSNSEKELLAPKTAQVKVKLSKQTLVLGDSTTLVIKGEHLTESFALIDWTRFTEYFAVEDFDQDSDRIRLKLYPLQAGEFSIAAQRAGAIDIPEFKIQVDENPDVSVMWVSPSEQVYSQQQVSWLAEVKVTNPAFKVQYQLPEGSVNEGVEVLLSEQDVLTEVSQGSEQQDSLLDSMFGKTHHLASSYLMPTILRPGKIKLNSPVVEVKNTSNKRWKFFDQSRVVELKTLPLFLPMSVAVAELDWQVDSFDVLYQAERLNHWQWKLSGQNVSADYLKSSAYQLLAQLEASSNVSWLSETMKTKQGFNRDGLYSELEVTIPYRIEQSGLVKIPNLALRSFDPASGKIVQINQAAHIALGLPSWLVWVLQWLMLAAVLVLFFTTLFLSKQAWYNLRFKKAITHSHSTADVWTAMQTWQHSHRRWQFAWSKLVKLQTPWQANYYVDYLPKPMSQGSLAQWQAWYAVFYGDSNSLNELIASMNKAVYAENENLDWPEAQQQAKEWLKELPLF